MTTRHRVLTLLEQQKGSFISGQHIAGDLRITRAAVWRAVRELRIDGYEIEASTRVGYRLALGSDKLSAEGMQSAPEWPGHVEIHYFDTIDSTNRVAKQLALEGAANGTVVVAGRQERGRGRMGRSFFSPGESGLYMSIILRLDLPSFLALRITCAAAVAVCEAMAQLGQTQGQIKWVNDIYMHGKKVCGILTEGVSGFESGRIESVVVGIGVNFSMPPDGFPDDLADSATALFPESIPPGVSRNRLCAAIVRNLLTKVEQIDSPDLMDKYRQLSGVIGKRVRALQGKAVFEADVKGISDTGALVVQTDDGATHTLSSGEITIRSLQGDF